MMNLKALDENYETLGEIKNSQEVVWNRLYHERGLYSIMCIPFRDYEKTKYVYRSDDYELGLALAVSYNSESKMLVISGFFSEHLLYDDIIFPTYKNTTILSVVDISKDLINKYCRLDNLIVEESFYSESEKRYIQETGKELGDKLYELLYTEESTFKMSYNFETNKLLFKVYKGVDKTDSQQDVPPVIFRVSKKNLNTFTYSRDESNYKNRVVVEGVDEQEGREEVRITEIIESIEQGDKIKEIYVDARDLTYDGTYPIEEFRESLRSRGFETLLEYNIIETISFTTTPVGYLTDYDLGDKVSVLIQEDNLTIYIETRIIGVKEIFKDGYVSLELTCGDIIPSDYDKIKMKGR